MGLTGENLDVGGPIFLSETSEGESTFLPFPASKGPSIPYLTVLSPSSKSVTLHLSESPSVFTSFCLITAGKH